MVVRSSPPPPSHLMPDAEHALTPSASLRNDDGKRRGIAELYGEKFDQVEKNLKIIGFALDTRFFMWYIVSIA